MFYMELLKNKKTILEISFEKLVFFWTFEKLVYHLDFCDIFQES